MVCYFYLTSDCELCDVALSFVLESGALHGYVLETIDISETDHLFERYGKRIPVLSVDDEELDWPFELKELKELLGQSE